MADANPADNQPSGYVPPRSGPGTRAMAGNSPISTGQSPARPAKKNCRSASMRCNSIRWARRMAEGHHSARGIAGRGSQRRRVRCLADQYRPGRPVRLRLCRHQSQLEDPGPDGPFDQSADAPVRKRLDPDLSRRKVRRLPAQPAAPAHRNDQLADVADGFGALRRRRLRPFLRLCAVQD